MNDSSFKDLVVVDATPEEVHIIRQLLTQWQARLTKNRLRSMYYDGEAAFKPLGLVDAPQLKAAKFYLGWPTMAVKKAASRSQFDGLSIPGGGDPFGLEEIFESNRFSLEFSQAVVSAYKHGVSFITLAAGGDGEGPVQIQGHSAETAAALWDRRRRRISACVTITDLDRNDQPTGFIVYLPDVVLTVKTDDGTFTADRKKNGIGQVLAVPVTYDPQIGQPFGRSRITNPVMALTDMAVRAFVRMESNAEFYSSPQLALLGVDVDGHGPGAAERFKLATDRVLMLSSDADGNTPGIQQLQQASMAPHNEYLRSLATAFAGETGIPVSSLGVIHDNPSSAEAIRAAEHDLLIDVTYQNKFVLSQAVEDIARLAIMIKDKLREPPQESWKLSARFVDPEFRSMSATADGLVKITSAFPDLAASEVLLEQVFDSEQIRRITGDRKDSAGQQLLEQVRQAAVDGDLQAQQAARLKDQAETLRTLRRAGVRPQDATKAAGLPHLGFEESPPA